MSRFLLILRNQALRDKAKQWVDKAPDGMRLEFREPVRSKEQNDKMWAMLTDISRQIKHQGRTYDPDRWKVLMLYALGQETEFIPSLDGMSFIPYGPRSSELSVAEMSELIEFIIAEGTKRGVIFHDPETKRGADGIATGPTEAGTNPPALQPKPNHAKEVIT